MDFSAHNNFSIVIPTYREEKNIPELLAAIASIDFSGRTFEVLLVDDNSQDGTAEVTQSLSQRYPWARLVRRNNDRNLSQAVIEGIKQAKYPIVITMDADLSHPAHKIPQLLAILDEPGVDIVIGSRYIKGGSTDPRWPMHRKIVSWLAALLARILLISSTKDPLSGFLAIRKTTINAGDELKPIGWKIGLEIMIKCHCKNIREIPIHFSRRRHGKSKLNTKISLQYLQHLVVLLGYKVIH